MKAKTRWSSWKCLRFALGRESKRYFWVLGRKDPIAEKLGRPKRFGMFRAARYIAENPPCLDLSYFGNADN